MANEQSTSQQLEALRAQHRALANLGQLALRERSLDVVFHAAVRLTREALGADVAKIVERRPGDGPPVITTAAGLPPELVGKPESSNGDDSQAAYSMRMDVPVIVENLPEERRFKPPQRLLETGIVSGVNVIIQGVRGPFGVLQVDMRTHRRFTEDDIYFLTAVANVLSDAIQRRADDDEREQFIAIASHELRNPLTSVLGFARRLATKLPESAIVTIQTREELETLVAQAERMQRTVGMLFELSEMGSLGGDFEPRPVALKALVLQTVGDVDHRHPDVRFEVAAPDGELLIASDETRIRRVLSNLADNAGKYSPEGSTVHVDLQATPGGASVRVRDACGGIPDEEVALIFGRYYRGGTHRQRASGLGIGLYVSERVARSLSGSIELENFPGDGCTFTLHLPDASTVRTERRHRQGALGVEAVEGVESASRSSPDSPPRRAP